MEKPPISVPTESRPTQPKRMKLYCPACQKRHIDEGVWANRPHKTHRCVDDAAGQGCGQEWRMDGLTPTVGVGFNAASSSSLLPVATPKLKYTDYYPTSMPDNFSHVEPAYHGYCEKCGTTWNPPELLPCPTCVPVGRQMGEQTHDVGGAFLREIRPEPESPSCHVCGSLTTPIEWKCVCCGTTTKPVLVKEEPSAT